ncbi:hypothetical protein DFH06DRAFT_689984 [Mycena polygramma]|nr:hypothetical protein DFH06DRAFT_689984 [Mycena polygramma]
MNDNNVPGFPEPHGEFVPDWVPASFKNDGGKQDMEVGHSFDYPAFSRAPQSGSRIDIIPPTPVEGSELLFQSHESLVYDVESSRGFQLPSTSPEPSRQRDGYQAESGYTFHSYGAISEPRQDIPDNHSSSGVSFLDTSQVDGAHIWDASPYPFIGQSNATFDAPFDHTPSTSNFPPAHGGRRRASFTLPTRTSEFLSGRASPVVSSDGFLSPYGAVNRHWRSKSDSARPMLGSTGSDSIMLLSSTESPPLISAYRRHARSVSSDGSVYSERSAPSPQWPSPYPSPDVSPQSNCSYLPDLDEFSVAGATIAIPSSVPKQHVASERTVQASQNRRKDVGRHTCPVPGCGSTFTRRVNLKGHLRAHNDERPFACGWDGCHKAFARLHDRKRHEQLHNVYRPFACEGCGKQFARLDALNRHLRTKCAEGCHQVMDLGQTPGFSGEALGSGGADELGQRISRFAL